MTFGIDKAFAFSSDPDKSEVPKRVDGGSIFPKEHIDKFVSKNVETGLDEEIGHRTVIVEPGMSMLDYFAGQALLAMGNWMPNYGDDHGSFESMHRNRARFAYEQAAAMLNERERILAAPATPDISTPVDE